MTMLKMKYWSSTIRNEQKQLNEDKMRSFFFAFLQGQGDCTKIRNLVTSFLNWYPNNRSQKAGRKL